MRARYALAPAVAPWQRARKIRLERRLRATCSGCSGAIDRQRATRRARAERDVGVVVVVDREIGWSSIIQGWRALARVRSSIPD